MTIDHFSKAGYEPHANISFVIRRGDEDYGDGPIVWEEYGHDFDFADAGLSKTTSFFKEKDHAWQSGLFPPSGATDCWRSSGI